MAAPREIMALLRSKPGLTGDEIAHELGITRAGAKQFLWALHDAGVLRVTQAPREQTTGRRKFHYYVA